MITRFLALSALVWSAAVSAETEPPRKPNGKWVVDFADSQCVATRDYGSEGNPLILALKAPPLGEVMQVNLLREGRGSRYAKHKRATIYIGDREIDTSGVAFTPKGSNQQVFRMNLTDAQFAAFSGAGTVRIRVSGELDETFELSQMQSLITVMDLCAEDLRQVWNVPETVSDTPPADSDDLQKIDWRGIFSAEDYPAVAIRNEASGTVTVALLIDEQGRVADCTVIESSSFAALDAQSCGVIRERGRFKAAVGEDGKSAKMGLVKRVTWRLQ